MAMAGVDNGPVLEGRDEWTMVHRVNDVSIFVLVQGAVL